MVNQSFNEKDLVTIGTTANIYSLSILLCLFFPSDFHVELLISAENLAEEEEEVMNRILAEAVMNYEKFNLDGSNHGAEGLQSFINHLITTYEVVLDSVKKGSVVIILDCPTLESLELLWSDYHSGHLERVAERYLISAEIKKKLNLETICLKTSIEKESYLNCSRALMKLSSTGSGEYVQEKRLRNTVMLYVLSNQRGEHNLVYLLQTRTANGITTVLS